MSVPAAARAATPQLDLVFARGGDGVTFLKRHFATYPFHVTRPFHFEGAPGGMAALMLQSLGAGLLRGDRLAQRLTLERRAAVLATTQGATLVQAVRGAGAGQSTRLTAAAAARLEYLPRPAILFPEAEVSLDLEIACAEDARVMWCDAFMVHDPAAAEGKTPPRIAGLRVDTVLRDDAGAVLARDRFEVAGGSPWVPPLEEAATMAGYGVLGSFGIARAGADDDQQDGRLAALWRRGLDAIDGVYGGVSSLPRRAGLVCRLLARDGIALRAATLTLWSLARRHDFGVEPDRGSRALLG